MFRYQDLMALYQAPAESDAAAGGAGTETPAAVDRGDVYVPEGTAAAEPAPAAAAAEPAPAAAAAAAEPAPAAADGAAAVVADDAAAAAADDADKKPAITVPKSRLDEVLAKNRQLQTQLADRDRQSAAAATELATLKATRNDLMNQYETAMMDGDAGKVAALRQQLDEVDAKRFDAQLVQSQSQAVLQVQSAQAYEQTITTVEAEFPMLNPDAPEYDAALEGEVAELMGAYATTGLPSHMALAKAVQIIAAGKGIVAVSVAAQPDPAAAAADPAADPAKLAAERIAKAEAAAAARKGGAVERNLAAAKATPPNLNVAGLDAGAGNSLATANVAGMTEKQFESFRKDEAALAAARGDVL